MTREVDVVSRLEGSTEKRKKLGGFGGGSLVPQRNGVQNGTLAAFPRCPHRLRPRLAGTGRFTVGFVEQRHSKDPMPKST